MSIETIIAAALVLVWAVAAVINYITSPQRYIRKIDSQIDKLRKEIEDAVAQRNKAAVERRDADVNYWLGRFVRLQQELRRLEERRSRAAR